MLAADQNVFSNDKQLEFPMQKKTMLYVNDTNNGQYSSEITFDLSTISNNDAFTSFNEAYIVIPYLVSMKSSADDTAAINPYSLGFKNGFHQIIDSFTVELNDRTIVQQKNNLNMLTSFKLMTQLSSDDLKKIGPTIGFYPDSSDSLTYGSYGTVGSLQSNDGYANNRNADYSKPTTEYNNTNLGFIERQKIVQIPSFSKGVVSNESDALTMLKSEGNSVYFTNGAAGANRVYNWLFMAQIRLKDICDWFDNVPLSKASYYRIRIIYNSCTSVLTATTPAAAGTNPITAEVPRGFVIKSHQQQSGRTNPILVAARNTGSANTAIDNASDITVSCGVLKNSLSSTSESALTVCRMYVPSYTIDADYLNLMIRDPVKTIKYHDYFVYPIEGITGGNTFSHIISNGIVNPRFVLILPFQTNNTSLNSKSLLTYQSPLDSAPATTTPASIVDLNVIVAGENQLMSNIQYTFQTFLDELQGVYAVAGGVNNGLNSGLVSQFDFIRNYRYYVCNCSRRATYDTLPKSVQVTGKNNTTVTMSYICFIISEISVNMNIVTSELV
jgi:hypothetical protein